MNLVFRSIASHQNGSGAAKNFVSGFHNVAAHKLITDADIGCDILVFGDDRAARAVLVGLVDEAGLRRLHGGALANSATR